MISRKTKTFFALLFLHSIVFVVYWRWVFDFSVLSAGDWGYYFKESQKEFFNLPFLWSSSTNLGGVVLFSSLYPILAVFGFVGKFFDFPYVERIVFFWPYLFFVVSGSFFFFRKIIQSEVGAVIASMVYILNTYFLTLSGGHLTLLTAFGIVPFAFLFFIKGLEEEKLHFSLVSGLFISLISFYEFRVFYLLSWILLFYFFFDFFVIQKKIEKRSIRLGVYAATPILLTFLLNFYWIFGLFQLGSLSSNALFDRGLFGSQYMSILSAITLFHPFWGSKINEFFHVQEIPWYFWFVPFIAISGFLSKRKDKHIIFFGVIALLGVLLSKQEGPPFEHLYLWLFQHVPGFNAFREASKFYFLIVLGYSLLIGAFVDSVWTWKSVFHVRLVQCGKVVVFVSLAGLFFWNSHYILGGQFRRLFQPRQVPSDYVILKDFIEKQPEFFRTLWTPRVSRWAFSSNNHPRLSNVNLSLEDWQNFSIKNEFLLKKEMFEVITSVLKNDFSNQLLDNASVKYVIVPLQDVANDDDFYISYGNKQYFIDELNKLDYLKKIDIGTKDVIVYENKDFRQHIYSDSHLAYIQSKKFDYPGSQNIYEQLPFGKEKSVFDFSYVNSFVLPVESDTDTIMKMQSEIVREKNVEERKKKQKEQKLYMGGLFFKEYVLNIPKDATYKLYIKKESALAQNRDIVFKVCDTLYKRNFQLDSDKDGWISFNTFALHSGKCPVFAYINRERTLLLDSGDIMFVADTSNTENSVPFIEYKQVSPTKYIVHIYGAKNSFPLIFSETFSPDWSIDISSEKLPSRQNVKFGYTLQNQNLLSGRYYDIFSSNIESKNNHFIINNFANAWWLDLPALEKSGKIVSENGEYNFSVTLEFKAQEYVYKGLFVSTGTLVLVFVYLLYKLVTLMYNKFRKNTGNHN